MSQSPATELTLGSAIDKFFGGPEQEVLETRFRPREDQLRQIILNAGLTKTFKETLSAMQLAAFEALRIWICFRSWDKTFDSAAHEATEAVFFHQLARDEVFRNSLDNYHLGLANLLYRELAPWPADRKLHLCRLNAVYLVSCQVMAQTFYRSLDSAPKSDLPRAAMDMNTIFKPHPLFPREHCTWLKQQPRQIGMPFFLWDVKNERTRSVQEIVEENGNLPDYVAVSHTWGRWKKETEPWISIPGVPWQIPQNSKFKVQHLPKMLRVLPFDYVWIDLFAIPQQELTSSMAELQKREIGRLFSAMHPLPLHGSTL